MIARIHADGAGVTHLQPLQLPADAGGTMRALQLPATGVGIHELSGSAPAAGFHSTSPRKLIAVLRGAFQITTSDGDRRRFGPGDCLLTDDLDSDGHAFEDVGDEPLHTIIVELGDDWRHPGE
jgi:uncharacterized cupin superfamily protein